MVVAAAVVVAAHGPRPAAAGPRRLFHDHPVSTPRRRRVVAAEAAAELRKASEAARSMEPGTVTWTGEFGSAGRPVNIRRAAAPSSASILARLTNGQHETSASSSGSGTPREHEDTPRGKDFMKLIRERWSERADETGR